MTFERDQPGRHKGAQSSGPVTDAFLRQACRRFQQAAVTHGGPTIRRYRIGGRGIELHFAGERLLQLLTPPLGHLAVPEADDQPFIVRIWDTASSGVKPPTPSWSTEHYGPRGDIRHDLGYHIHASYSIDGGMLSLFDIREGHAVCWVRDPEQLPAWDLAAPLRPILGWWASATNGQLAHGAAVGDKGVGILLTASGGSGKSTTALSCLDAGLSYLGDDYVMLRSGEPPLVCSLYSTAKLTPDHLRRVLPQFQGRVVRGVSDLQDKVTLQLGQRHAAQLVPMLPLGAILITAVARDGRTAVAPASRAEALQAMAPTTIFQLPGAGAGDFARMAAIVRRVACHRLHLGTDTAANVAAIRGVIEACAPEDGGEGHSQHPDDD